MRNLKTGTIYSFHYKKYKHDPNPLALILYADNNIVHSLNFHYLHGDYNTQLIHMIASIAVKTLKIKSMYRLYHGWMKRNIPGVIKKAYRTYKPQHIIGAKPITKGAWGVSTFLNAYAQKGKHIQLTKVQKRLSEKISKKKSEEFAKKAEKVNMGKLEKNIESYVDKVDNIIKSSKKEDRSKYTYV